MHAVEDWRQECGQGMPVGETKQTKGADKAANHGEDRQHDQGDGHDEWNFMDIVEAGTTYSLPPRQGALAMNWLLLGFALVLFFSAVGMARRPATTIVACEDATDEPEHVEGRQACCDDTQCPQGISQTSTSRQQRAEYFVFAPEACEGWYATDRQGGDQESPEGNRQPPPQSTHLTHVLLAAKCVNDRTRAQEQQGFEVSVGRQVKNTPAIVMHTFTHKHVAKLADRRIGQDALNVKLKDGDGGGEEGRDTTNDANGHQCKGGNLKQWIGTSDEIHARRDHGCSMDECADRCWTFHCIGQPHIQRQLRGFGGTRDEEQQADDRCDTTGRCLVENPYSVRAGKVIQRTVIFEHQEDGDHQAEVTNDVDDQCLLRCRDRCTALVPKTDQQER